MAKKSDIPVFPIAGWQIGPLPGYDALILKFQFLTSPTQSLEEVQETQYFGITPDMAREMISELEKHIQTVENSSAPIQPSEKH